PISIEVVDRQSGAVLLKEDEGGAADRPAVGDVEPLSHGADEMCLAGAEGANQGDDRAGEELLSQTPAERRGGVGVGEVEDQRLGHAPTPLRFPTERTHGPRRYVNIPSPIRLPDGPARRGPRPVKRLAPCSARALYSRFTAFCWERPRGVPTHGRIIS